MTVWEPPTTLEYTWLIPGEPRSVIRFWLVPSGADTVLRVTHRRLPTPMAAGYAAGWHAHADQLAAAVVGTPIPDWDDRFAVLLPRYVELVSS